MNNLYSPVNITCTLGLCKRYKGLGRGYSNGQKLCKSCDIVIVWEGAHCPCCGMKLRTSPRSKSRKDHVRY